MGDIFMGLLTSEAPPVEPASLLRMPYLDRIKILSRHWVDYGAGLPKYIMLIYVVKMAAFAVAGVVIATTSAGLDPFHTSAWFQQPIVWQKLVVWVILVEVLGVGGAWGPLCGHFKPMTGGVTYWARRGTIRLPPWAKRMPFTEGDTRTTGDVVLYLALLASLAVGLAIPGSSDSSITRAIGHNSGRLPAAAVIVPIVLLLVVGLRDKTIFLAARGEQWLPALVFFAFYPFVDMVVAGKLLIVLVWFGAAASKLNRHFEQVIPPMVSNTPWNPFKGIKRRQYANPPEDLRPSHSARRLSHVGGAVGELIPPWILLFSHNTGVTIGAAVFMMCYHAFIISTFPLAVPLEWNLMFIYLTGFLFLGYQANDGYSVGQMNPALLAATVVGLLIFPVLGELRPRLVSFLPSLRQYSGNWAASMWAFAPGCEQKLNEHITKPSEMQVNQLTAMFDADTAHVSLHQYLAWRAMHSQGRGLNSVMASHLGDDLDVYDLREGEITCNAVIGWNFGDGHLHDQSLVEAIQKRCHFKPGELIVVGSESEPLANGHQEYWVMHAAFGVVERGSWVVAEAVAEQPWLPNGPIARQITWRADYQRISHGAPMPPADTRTGAISPETQP